MRLRAQPDAGPDGAVDRCLEHRLLHLGRTIDREMARQLKAALGLTIAEWRVLSFVCATDAASAVDLTGMTYGSLANAFKYRKTLVEGCRCRPQPWSQSEAERHRGYATARSGGDAVVSQDAGLKDAEGVSEKVAKAFVEHANWRQSEAELRELRKAVTFAVYAEMDDVDEVTRIVDRLFSRLAKAT